jgi:peptidoglycan/LPS O-acetylase OafA/YrhL
MGNVIMIHSLFRVPHVDGVYWTLEIEVLFYCGMFLLYRLGRLHQIHHALLGLLALRLTYFVLERSFGIELSWTLSRLLILGYIPWFSIGIAIYQATSCHTEGAWRQPALTAACAILTLSIVDTPFVTGLAVFLGSAVFLAASGRASLLRHPVLVWLGTISYPLYLLHENIGWSLQLRLGEWGIPTDATVVIVLAVSLTMATAVSRWVERPAMRWIRNGYRNRLAFAQ